MTTLINIESLTDCDVQIVAQWKQSTNIGLHIVRVLAGDPQSIAADSGFQE